MMKINLQEKFEKISGYWHPYIIGELNENFIKLARLKGTLIWHKHEDEDEMFVVIKGTLLMEFRDGRTLKILPGEVLIIPKGIEHLPGTMGEEEVEVMLIEPKNTKHTGEIVVKQTVQNFEWI